MMEAKELLTGIAVVIDDAIYLEPQEETEAIEQDTISEIVRWFEEKWHISFVKSASIPESTVWPNLLTSASFVLLDWKLWAERVGEEAKRRSVNQIIEFLRIARDRFVPVFIFTNEDPADVLYELPDDVYDESIAKSNFLLIKSKLELWLDGSFDTTPLDEWVRENASVYALKVWNRELDLARNELFAAMYKRSKDWPRVFWHNYKTDRANPSASLTNLICDSLHGRLRTDAFEEDHLGGILAPSQKKNSAL